MTRRSSRQNGGLPGDLQNGIDLDREDKEAASPSMLKNHLLKANGPIHAAKQPLKKSVKDIPLKDRLKSLRENEMGVNGGENMGKTEERGDYVQGIQNASTSNKDASIDIGDKPVPVTSRGESLAVLLDQGLTSGDAEKIDAVLSKTDIHTISATLNDLPVTQIIPLLKQIEYRLRNRSTLDIRCWIRWAQSIISMHTSYLSTMANLEEELQSLFDWMKSRTKHLGKLLELHGKLSLITEQMERRSNPRLFVSQEPKIFFSGDDVKSSNESDDDTDEFEDNESMASDDDWWDDDEIASEGSELSGNGLHEAATRKKQAASSDEDEEEGDDDDDVDGDSEEDDDEEDDEEAGDEERHVDEMDVD